MPVVAAVAFAIRAVLLLLRLRLRLRLRGRGAGLYRLDRGINIVIGGLARAAAALWLFVAVFCLLGTPGGARGLQLGRCAARQLLAQQRFNCIQIFLIGGHH